MLEKIDFENGQQPAINDVNLNKMQDNIEEYIDDQILNVNNKINNMQAVTLYSSANGTKNNFNLSDDITNYEYTEVIGKRGEQYQCSTKGIVNKTGNTSITLISTYYGYGNNMWVDQLELTMSGTTATITEYSSLNGLTGSLQVEHAQNISVLEVIGYKEVTE